MVQTKTVNTKDLIKQIRDWNPYCEHITLATIFAKMKFDKGTSHVINQGAPGTGKSRSTLELIKALDMGNDIVLDNTTTDRGLFDTFMEYPEQDIILDECSTLLRSLRTQDMVKQAMEGHSLVWTKDGMHEETPPYKGNIIVNTNVHISAPVIDRCLMNKAIMNKEMSLAFNDLFVAEYLKAKDFKPFITQLKQILSDKTAPALTEADIKMILEFTKNHVRESERDEGFSRRIIIRQISYFQRAKKLFGKLDEEVLSFVQPFAENYIMNEHTPGLIESILGNGAIDKALLVKRIAREGNYTEPHARRLISKALETGELVLKGKLVSKA